ncbi:MAG: carboxypeptidase-like regulatory domain-containing protein [Rikenellaceae bacterium]|jgi:hypothetical protein|nr:carboxypeptidase-like regulatory domain-containing protein [Rikenellaceae bacterium]
MKTIQLRFVSLFWAIVSLLATWPSSAQSSLDFFTVSGTVRDGESHRPLANVTVSIPDSPVGTITNDNGSFSLKIRSGSGVRAIEFSHIGYFTQRVSVSGRDQSGLRVDLAQRSILLEDVEILNRDPLILVEQALRRVETNYSDRSAVLTGFYRETVQKRQQYIDITEAVVEVYDTPYTQDSRQSAVRIVKGRRLVTPRAADTLAVVLQGGPNTYLFANLVREKEFVLDPQTLHFYRFRIDDVVSIDGRLHDVVSFTPRIILLEQALFTGQLFIDRQTLTISRAEFGLDMSDQWRATQTILRKKPATLRFYPDEVSFVANYRQHDGRSYLNYISNTIRFRCDWRRRLFRTNYTVKAEMVITDAIYEDVVPIRSRESFPRSTALSKRIADFYDPAFWEAYNIIEPTESLEFAVDRLRKRSENE